MVDDDSQQPTHKVEFALDRTAQILHDDLAKALRTEPLSLDLVQRALERALMIGLGEAAAARRARMGDKAH